MTLAVQCFHFAADSISVFRKTCEDHKRMSRLYESQALTELPGHKVSMKSSSSGLGSSTIRYVFISFILAKSDITQAEEDLFID